MLFFTINPVWYFLSWVKVNLRNQHVSQLHKEWLWQGWCLKIGQRNLGSDFFFLGSQRAGECFLTNCKVWVWRVDCGKAFFWMGASHLPRYGKQSKIYFPVSDKLWCIVRKFFLILREGFFCFALPGSSFFPVHLNGVKIQIHSSSLHLFL